MFLGDRRVLIERVILSDGDDRQDALDALLPMQRKDFYDLLEELEEVGALQRQQCGECCLAVLVVGQDDALDEHPAVAEEHVLGAGEADALGTEVPGPRGVLGGVGVGPHAQPADLVGVREEAVDAAHERGGALVGVDQRAVEALLEVGDHG